VVFFRKSSDKSTSYKVINRQNWNRSSDVLLSLHTTGTRKQPAWQQWWTIWSKSHWRPGVTTNGWPCFIVCNITWCLLLQLITLFRFSGRTAEDQVMTKCIKFLTLGPMSTSTPSFQQLYACGTLYLHLWSILILFSPSKQPSVFITDTDSRDHKPQCVIRWYSAYRGMHFIGRWRWIMINVLFLKYENATSVSA